MKNPIIIIAFAAISTIQIAKAQTEKGTQTMGANLQFFHNSNKGVSISPYDNSTSTTDQKNTSFSIGPNYSFFLANDLDLGASLSYGVNKITDAGTSTSYAEQLTHAYGANIYLRKYFMYQNKIGIRTGPYVGYSRNDFKTTNQPVYAIYDNKSKTDNYGGGINMELLFYPTKQLGLSLMLANLNYNHFKTDNGAQGRSDGDGVNFNFINNGLGLSVFYVIGSK